MTRFYKAVTLVKAGAGALGLWFCAFAPILIILALTSVARAEDWTIGSAQAEPSPAPEPQFSFSIGRLPLPAALGVFSTETRAQLIYETPVAAGRYSSPVSGKLGAFDALRQLLAGTGLTPAQLFPNGYTLIPEQNGLAFATASPISAPTLALKPLHVEAPQPENHRLYAMSLQYAIQAALQRDGFIHRNNFCGALLLVWLNSGGAIAQSSFRISTGDPSVDVAIANVVRKVAVGQLPPYGLPQPVYIHILAQTASR